jgi:hypothetical protein
MADGYSIQTLFVPIQLVQLVHTRKLHKALGIYLLMKASCDGHMVLTPGHRLSIMHALRLKTVRSFEKHLQKLVELNWVGYDDISRTYYVRSFKSLRKTYSFYQYRAVPFSISKDSATITEFVKAAIICNDIVRRQRARKAKIIKEAGRSACKKERAVQELIALKRITPYCGLSNELMGKLLGVSKSQADRLKKRMEDIGYLKANAKYRQVCQFHKPDYLFLKHLPANRRYSLEIITQAETRTYKVMERTYDELISCMEFINQKAIVRKLKSANM